MRRQDRALPSGPAVSSGACSSTLPRSHSFKHKYNLFGNEGKIYLQESLQILSF